MLSGSVAYLAVVTAYEQHAPTVLDYAYRYVQDWGKAEEVASTVWERAVKNWHRFDGRSFLAWMHTLVKNTAIEHYRSSGSHPSVSLTLYDDGDFRPSITPLIDKSLPLDLSDLFEDTGLHERVRCAVLQLTLEEREVLRLHSLGLSGVEAAAILDIKPNYFRVRLFRAIAHVRENLPPEIGFTGCPCEDTSNTRTTSRV